MTDVSSQYSLFHLNRRYPVNITQNFKTIIEVVFTLLNPTKQQYRVLSNDYRMYN